MKKVKNAKLSFNKETISILNNNSLDNVKGGDLLFSIIGKKCKRTNAPLCTQSAGPTTCPDNDDSVIQVG